MKTIFHVFMPGDTITAVLKKFNGYTRDEEKLDHLQRVFEDLNGSGIFRPGTRAEIPVIYEPEKEE